jgi:hypothetical protein
VPDVGLNIFTVTYPDGTHQTSLASLYDEASPDPAVAAVLDFQDKLLNVRASLPDDVIGADAPYAWTSLRVISHPANLDSLPDPQLAQYRDWPLESLATLGQPMDAGDNYRCAAISGDDLAILRPMLDDSNELTIWRSDGQQYQLILHPLLPDDSDCPG